jgi:hypothetical protein
MLGYPDQALRRSHEMLTYAQKLQHPISLAGALFNVATLHKLGGEAAATQKWAEASFRRAVVVARRQQAKSWELRAAMSLRKAGMAPQPMDRRPERNHRRQPQSCLREG